MIKTSSFIITSQDYDLSHPAAQSLSQIDNLFLGLIQPQTNLPSSVHSQVSNLNSNVISEKPSDAATYNSGSFADSALLSLLVGISSSTHPVNVEQSMEIEMEAETIIDNAAKQPKSDKVAPDLNVAVAMEPPLESPVEGLPNNDLIEPNPTGEFNKPIIVDQNDINVEFTSPPASGTPWQKDSRLLTLPHEVHIWSHHKKTQTFDVDEIREDIKPARYFFEAEINSVETYTDNSYGWDHLDGQKLKLTKSPTEGIKQFEELIEFTWYATGALSSFTTVANTTPAISLNANDKNDPQTAVSGAAIAVTPNLHVKQKLFVTEEPMSPVTYKDTHSDLTAQKQAQGNHTVINFIQATFPEFAKYRITVSLSNSELNITIRDYELKDIEKKNIKNLLTELFNSQGKIINSITFNGKLYS